MRDLRERESLETYEHFSTLCEKQTARKCRSVLERDDLTDEQRKEIAETLSTRVVSFEVETEISVDR